MYLMEWIVKMLEPLKETIFPAEPDEQILDI